MNIRTLLVYAALGGVSAFAQNPGLLENITTADRAVSTQNQTLTGTWAALSRRAAPPGTPIPPAAPVFFVFHRDGTLTGAGAGTDSPFSGVWMRVADRKFLVTYYVMNYNDARAVISIVKIRMTTEIDANGLRLHGNQEVLAIDLDGNPMFTALGGTHSMVRLGAEKPADYDSFLAN